jgi:DNA-binding HxlR family transcriptional regulator
MWDWGKRIREETKNKILKALAEKKELSFNQLAKETGISRRILAKRLKELKAELKVVDEIKRSERGPPKIVYRLTQDLMEEMEPAVKELILLHDIEKKFSLVIEWVKASREDGRLTPSEAGEKMIDLTTRAARILISYALGRKPLQNEDLDSIVLGEAMMMIRKLFFNLGVKDEEIRSYFATIFLRELEEFEKYSNQLLQT